MREIKITNGQLLSFLRNYIKLNHKDPYLSEISRGLQVSPTTVYSVIIRLSRERKVETYKGISESVKRKVLYVRPLKR